MTNAEKEYAALEAQMQELKRRMIALSTEVHGANAPGKKDDDARDHVASMADLVGVKKAAVLVRQDAERQLDALAKSDQGPGETYERAYSRVLETPVGRGLLATLGDAQRLSVGQPSEAMVEAHRKSLAVQ